MQKTVFTFDSLVTWRFSNVYLCEAPCNIYIYIYIIENSGQITNENETPYVFFVYFVVLCHGFICYGRRSEMQQLHIVANSVDHVRGALLMPAAVPVG